MPTLQISGGLTPPSGKSIASASMTAMLKDEYVDGNVRHARTHTYEHDSANARWKPAGAMNGTAATIPGGANGSAYPPETVFTVSVVYTDGTTDSWSFTLRVFESSAGVWNYKAMPAGTVAVSGNPTPAANALLTSQLNVANGVPQLNTAAKLSVAQMPDSYTPRGSYSLITNGFGERGDNYNFSNTSYVNNAYGIGFTNNNAYATLTTDEYIPVNTNNVYQLRYSAVCTTANASNKYHYGGLACYDADKNAISPQHYYHPANTETTLAQPLATGATIIYLNSVANWASAANRYLQVFGYVSASGVAYSGYSYTRNIKDISNAFTVDAVANTITLATPYTGAAMPAGTPVALGQSGGYNLYCAASNVPLTNTIQKFSAVIRGVGSNYASTTTQFFPGTAYVRALWLLHREQNGSAVVTAGTTQISEVRFDLLWDGDIVESGTDGGGTYEKFADGRMVWRASVLLSYTSTETVEATINLNAAKFRAASLADITLSGQAIGWTFVYADAVIITFPESVPPVVITNGYLTSLKVRGTKHQSIGGAIPTNGALRVQVRLEGRWY